jgi:hypothetical protein
MCAFAAAEPLTIKAGVLYFLVFVFRANVCFCDFLPFFFLPGLPGFLVLHGFPDFLRFEYLRLVLFVGLRLRDRGGKMIPNRTSPESSTAIGFPLIKSIAEKEPAAPLADPGCILFVLPFAILKHYNCKGHPGQR